jgi:CHAD domain-containing protein
MQPVGCSLIIPARVTLRRLLSRLSEAGYSFGNPVVENWRSVYYDTQDGRLFKHQLRLFRAGGDGPWILNDGDRIFAPDAEAGMHFEPGKLPTEVQSLVSGHRLIPYLELQVRQSSITFEGASKGRLLLQKWHFTGGYRKMKAPGPKVLCIAEQQDTSELEHLVVILREAAGSVTEPSDPLEAGLQALGLPLPGTPLPEELRLASSDSVMRAAGKILAQQEYRMTANTEGTLQDLDPEFLHDLRVAVRRCRFAVRQFKAVLLLQAQSELKEELKWIGGLLGRVRDLDVFGEVMRTETEAVDSDEVSRQKLLEHVQDERTAPRLELEEALRSERYRQLTQRLRGPLPEPLSEEAGVEISDTVDGFAGKQIRKRAGKVLEMSPQGEEFSGEELHQLRIALKGLRYTCEFYRDLYPDRLQPLIASLVILQDTLGAHQDAVVAEAKLSKIAETFGRGEAPYELGLVLGRLLERQTHKAVKNRARFEKIWPKKSKRIRKFRRSLKK